MSQPKQTTYSPKAEAADSKPSTLETASVPPAKGTPAAGGGTSSAVTGQASLGAVKENQEGNMSASKSSASKGECAKAAKAETGATETLSSVAAGGAARAAASKGKTETKSKEMSKNVSSSSSKDKPAKVEPAAPVLASTAAASSEGATTKEKSKQKAPTEAPKDSKKVESKKKPAKDIPSSPLAPPADKKAKDSSPMSPDALSALGDLLPAAEPVPQPPKIQPRDIVQEEKHKSEKGVRVGEREDTLPADYRFTEDKMKDYPPPQKEPSLDSGEALDILSGDFSCPAVAASATEPSKQSSPDVAAVDALAGDFVAPKKASSVQAPMIPSAQTQQKNVSSSSSKDKPAKVEPAAPVLASTAAASAGGAAAKEKSKQKAPTEAPKDSKDSSPMSPDALSALGDLLPAAEPVPQPPKIQPRDIVQEEKHKSEKGVRVGEREDTLPADYRFTEDKMKDYPPPQKEPSLDSGEALDILSGDFSCPAVAASATEPSKQSSPDVAAVDALAGEFVAPKKASSVQAPMIPPAQNQQKDISMSPDALSALGDLLPAAESVPESPKVQPQAIVQEEKLKSEKGVRVGEREDTLPPEYRFTEDKMKDYPPPQKEPSMDLGEALDILSGDFSCPTVAPATTVPATTSKQSSPDVSAVDALAGDFVAPKKAASVEAPMIPPAQTQQKDNSPMSPDALSALEDLLPAAEPTPEPPKIQPQEIVQEEKLKSEKGVRVGEREDTLPPEYRFTEDKMKDYPPPQKEPSMDSGEALDILSGDFSFPAPLATVPATTSKQSNSDAAGGAAADTLAGDFVAPKKASSVQPAMIPSSQTQQQVADKKVKSKSKKQTQGDTSTTDKRTEHSGTDVATKTPSKKSSRS
ncbi:calpastatin-like isoform X2 [Scleropages formosus]|uniref:calpastatin-like isoform X2 n=1 Tax=Scleropages formosus TaxID=113540 RepID=UPI0010FACE4E|nr:calpastatin-like isoform X2 [Scleropages formosus]